MLSNLLQLDPMIVTLLASVSLFFAVVLLFLGFVPDEIEEDDIYGYRERKRQRLIEESPLYRWTLPMIKVFAHHISRLGDWGVGFIERRQSALRNKLPRSGYLGAYSANEFMGLSCTVGLAVFIVLLWVTLWLTGAPRFALAGILAPISMYLPFLSLNSAITQRLVEIDRRLPYTMDLLVLSMRAGLDFMTALDRVVEQGRAQNPEDPTIQELSVVLQELRVGTPRAEALKNLVERVRSDYLESMVGAIVQAEKRGTPLASVLEVQVDTIRKKRTQRVEKKASQAAVKILIPLMFIFGAVVLLVLGMMILRVQQPV